MRYMMGLEFKLLFMTARTHFGKLWLLWYRDITQWNPKKPSISNHYIAKDFALIDIKLRKIICIEKYIFCDLSVLSLLSDM